MSQLDFGDLVGQRLQAATERFGRVNVWRYPKGVAVTWPTGRPEHPWMWSGVHGSLAEAVAQIGPTFDYWAAKHGWPSQ